MGGSYCPELYVSSLFISGDRGTGLHKPLHEPWQGLQIRGQRDGGQNTREGVRVPPGPLPGLQLFEDGTVQEPP